jgi:hypothetical protein
MNLTSFQQAENLAGLSHTPFAMIDERVQVILFFREALPRLLDQLP